MIELRATVRRILFLGLQMGLAILATRLSASWSQDPAANGSWIWMTNWTSIRNLSAIEQTLGNHDFVLQEAPSDYVWESSIDGIKWRNLRGTRVRNEARMHRRFTFPRNVKASHLRLRVTAHQGTRPAIRELRIIETHDEEPGPTPWILVVNVTHESTLPGHGREFIPLARAVRPGIRAQQIWIPDCRPEFVAIEPRPEAVFLSGSFRDWCQVDRESWRGLQRVLKEGRTPIWGSCGGAQGLAILATAGVDGPWDCPHCRDPRRPRLPVYGHIGHLHPGPNACGDYSGCVFERGPHWVKQTVRDPVFRELPDDFQVMESHCGQIEFAPRGWHVVAGAGKGTRTSNQALRWGGRPIYAAQFHIEMDGTPENSSKIMNGFLTLAEEWNRRSRHTNRGFLNRRFTEIHTD